MQGQVKHRKQSDHIAIYAYQTLYSVTRINIIITPTHTVMSR